jgi:DNA-binding CsgD family transcriptional regulator
MSVRIRSRLRTRISEITSANHRCNAATGFTIGLMATSELRPVGADLVGRARECAMIDRVLRGAASGESSSLVVRGEPGIGKTALLSYAAHRAADSLVLRTAGLEAESDLAFAGLHGLLRPVTGKLGELPDTQAAALAGALGLAHSPSTDRFLVSAATLSLIAAAAEERPLVCVIDDAQWLDSASADALLFAARRLRAEPVAMLFGAREGEARSFPAPGLSDLMLAGLAGDVAGDVLSVSAAGAAGSTRTWLLAQAVGNPLALLELPSGLSEDQLEGRAPLPEAIPLTARLQGAFAQRAESLSADTRAVLLIAAIDDIGDAATILSAATEAGLHEAALDAAERSGLVSVTAGRIMFRHPLVRSALHGAATLSERRHAHRALAAVLSGEQQGDRRVWHQALAALTPDEVVATELQASAERARARAAHASAATAFIRSSELSAEDGGRIRRLAAAADAAWAAGDPDRARAVIAKALPLASGRVRAGLLQLRGTIEARTGDVKAAIVMLLEAAEVTDDSSLRLELLVDAADAALYAGEYDQVVALASRGCAVEARTELDRFRKDVLGGLAGALSGDYGQAAPLLSRAIARAELLDDPRSLIWAGRLARLAGTVADGSSLTAGAVAIATARAVAIARERALVSVLPAALQEHSTALIARSRFRLAYAAAEEAVGIARDFGQRWGASWSLANLASIDALRGDETLARAHAEAALELASTSGADFMVGWAKRALGLLELTLGRPSEATDQFLPLTNPDRPESNPIIALAVIPDLLEAAVRSGRLGDLDDQLDRYAQWAERAPVAPRLALLARCRALVGDGNEREQFTAALAHAAALAPFQQARTELLYGEWLRRQREAIEARDHLRRASELFQQVGTPPWAQRAEVELRATGETARRRDPSTLDDLTPQELQIAGLVASGMTNRQIAAQLYLSPRTIEYHLRKIFAKLRLASRTELVRMGVPNGDADL